MPAEKANLLYHGGLFNDTAPRPHEQAAALRVLRRLGALDIAHLILEPEHQP